jgi:hypothetical protein
MENTTKNEKNDGGHDDGRGRTRGTLQSFGTDSNQWDGVVLGPVVGFKHQLGA